MQTMTSARMSARDEGGEDRALVDLRYGAENPDDLFRLRENRLQYVHMAPLLMSVSRSSLRENP